MGFKYSGDAKFGGSLTVQSNKPLDNRLVVDSINNLYSIAASTAYAGMPVVVSSGGTSSIYILKDISNIDNENGWIKLPNITDMATAISTAIESATQSINGNITESIANALSQLEDEDTTYDRFDRNNDGLVPKSGDLGGENTHYFLRADGTWAEIELTQQTQYNVFDTTNNGLVPKPTQAAAGTLNTFLCADGTWRKAIIDSDIFDSLSNGLVPKPTQADITAKKVLCADGTWVEDKNEGIASVFDTTNNGLVPKPTQADVTAKKVLCADGTWVEDKNEGIASVFNSSSNGLVPKPTQADIVANKVLGANGQWVEQTGGSGGGSQNEDVGQKHIFITQEDYNALEEYEQDALYCIVPRAAISGDKPFMFGDSSDRSKFPIIFGTK